MSVFSHAYVFFFQAEDGIRDLYVTGVQTCALPIYLGTLSEAVWEAQRVQIGYDRGDKTVDRVLEPLGLVLKAGVWYLVAAADGQPRTYRVSRVARVTPLDERFDRPDGFDLAAFWTESSS